MLKVSYYSDLHLEGSGLKPDCNNSDISIFAGDIFACGQASIENYNNPIDWIGNNTPSNQIAIFVPGNHDFEGAEIVSQMEAWKEISNSRYNNRIKCLWNEAIDIGGVRFIGTPLFTNFSSTGNPGACKKYAREYIVDFAKIAKRVNDKLEVITPDDYQKWFNDAFLFLDSQLSINDEATKVVITHFSPSFAISDPKRPRRIEDSYWVNALEDLVKKANIWISGHTHYSGSAHIGENPDKGNMYSNARGYSRLYNLSADHNFKTDALLNILPNINSKKLNLSSFK